MWVRLSRAIMKRPAVFAAGTVRLPRPARAAGVHDGARPGSNEGIPQDLEGIRGLNIVSEELGDGALAPTAIVIDTGEAGGVGDPAVQDALGRLREGLAADPEVAGVTFDPRSAQGVDPTGRYLQVQVTGQSEYGVPESLDFVERAARGHHPGRRLPGGCRRLRGRRAAGRQGLPRPSPTAPSRGSSSACSS